MTTEIKKLSIVLVETTHLAQSVIPHGWGNGYVVLPQGHKYYEVDYDDIDVDVHWGLTLAAYVSQMNGEKWRKFDPMAWVVGFDTSHFGDSLRSCPMEWVFKETQRLRDQLMEA